MKDVLYTLYVGMFISAKRNSFQNTLCIQSQRQRIYGQIIYIKLCKSPLDRLFEKGNGGGAKGRKIIQRDVYVQYCGITPKWKDIRIADITSYLKF